MKKLLMALAALLLIAAAGAAWIVSGFYIVDSRFYPKDAQQLDLRGTKVDMQHYEKLHEKLPDCEILWDVPFQGERWSSDASVLTAKNLTEDMEMLAYFPNLETLDAEGCQDLAGLAAVSQAYPELTVLISASVNGQICDQDTREIRISSVTEEELSLLPYLSSLQQVTVTEGGDGANLQQLKDYCMENGIDFQILLNGQSVTEAEKKLTVEGTGEDTVSLLSLMSWLEELHLPEPEAGAESILALAEALPDTKVTWEKTVLGMTFDQDAAVIDLTDVIAQAEGEGPEVKTAYEYGLEYPVMGEQEAEPSTAKVLRNHPFPDKSEQTEQLIAEVEAAMAYFPGAEELRMCGAWLDNEAMSQFRERHRQDYRVVWTVLCGDVAPNTDTTFFMPTKYGVPEGGFNDFYAENLRYCEDIVAMDIGHMLNADIEFLKYMPDLKYLVLFSQPVQDLSPLAYCKNLVYLELYMCDLIQDYSPLLECTALEDLNISRNDCDITPVLEMDWLKNLWLVEYDADSYQRAKEALPGTNIGYYYGDPSNGWRSIPNYFKMRDALLMFYMK